MVGDAFWQLAGEEVNFDGAKDVSFVVMLVEVVDGIGEVWEAMTGNVDADRIGGELVWADDFDEEDEELVARGTKDEINMILD